MSKQSEAKEKQRYRLISNMCSNCHHFTSDVTTHYGRVVKETYMRCNLGNFKVMKSATCDKHEVLF
jgi:hypothetical protein